MAVTGMKIRVSFRAAVVILVLLAAFIVVFTIFNIEQHSPVGGNVSSLRTVVIDPGHGGGDGGAVGYSGSIEKDLNLDISLKLKDVLKFCGFHVVMTREDDRSIHDPSAKTTAQQKTSDLNNRLKIYNADPSAIVVSIHQNLFADKSCCGAQMFYSTNNKASQELAQSIQSSFVLRLQPENKRLIKPAENNLFLLFHATVPAVLCECGFVSNPAEEAKLLDPGFRSQVSFTVFCGIMDYYNS